MKQRYIQQDGPIFIGIDGGGTKCKALLYHPSHGVLATGLAGPANAATDLAATCSAIIAASMQALQQAGFSQQHVKQAVVGAGLAGVNLPSVMAAMLNWQHPFAQFYVTSDLHTACLGAHNQQDGGIIITGTGSCGYYRQHGSQRMLGGHGFPLGDKAGGSWFGLMALQKALEQTDGLTTPTLLTKLIAEHLNSDDPLYWVEQFHGKGAGQYATLAPVIFNAAEQQDEFALTLIHEAVNYISELVKQMQQSGVDKVAIFGGISQVLMPYFPAELQRIFSPVIAPPEMGAVYFAQQQLGMN